LNAAPLQAELVALSVIQLSQTQLLDCRQRDRFHPRFRLLGSINTKEACEAAGGEFLPHVFGWMVHVYPYETDPKKVWSVDEHDAGHDNMDHSAMPGMKMD
jgi:hypothetical protein